MQTGPSIDYFKKNLMLHYSDVKGLDVPLPELVNNNVWRSFNELF